MCAVMCVMQFLHVPALLGDASARDEQGSMRVSKRWLAVPLPWYHCLRVNVVIVSLQECKDSRSKQLQECKDSLTLLLILKVWAMGAPVLPLLNEWLAK